MSIRIAPILVLALSLFACGGESTPPPPATPAPQAQEALPEPDDLPQGLVLALAQFVTKDGKPVPGPARLEFLTRQDGAWQTSELEDPDGNVFHKAMVYDAGDGPVLLTMAGSRAAVKAWRSGDAGLVPETVWEEDFGGRFSRMRDAEVGDLFGDGGAAIAVATHDQGVVSVLRPQADGFSVTEIDRKPDTFVHEIEIGDVDGDGALEVYATPSEPNRLDGSPQSGAVVRYVPSRGEGPTVVADLGHRHAKEILVEDVDGDGRDELYVSVEGHMANKQLVDPVEIRRYEADTPPDAGEVIATLDDRLTRFLTAGDVDGDGNKELVAATFKQGVWLLRPASGGGARGSEQLDADSGGFEHAAILTDLDGDGTD